MKINDIFNELELIDLSKCTCHSGGAVGSDTIWEMECMKYGIKVNAYSYNTDYHKSVNKVEISDYDYKEGILSIKRANKILKRYNIGKYMNLLARNWSQVKYAEHIYAIGRIVNPGDMGNKYVNKSKSQIIDGGTGYAIQMAIDNNKVIYVYNMNDDNWYTWSYTFSKFIKCKELPIINTLNFAGIGSREITESGKSAIIKILKISNNKNKCI